MEDPAIHNFLIYLFFLAFSMAVAFGVSFLVGDDADPSPEQHIEKIKTIDV